MPPWKANPEFSHFRDERILSDFQKNLLKRWVNEGMQEGTEEDKMPAVKVEQGDWRMGKPDLILKMTEAYKVPAKGTDVYRYFVIPNAIKNDIATAILSSFIKIFINSRSCIME